ncbi:MAG: FAD:protein FMN transferase [Muribaculaceae bacterium]|nr:FAD:protein FMN transferase [Muribaculaceae bacterium]
MNKSNLMRLFVFVTVVTAAIVFFVTRDRTSYMTAEGVIWTTEYHITYECDRNLADSINTVFNRIDNSANVYNKLSLVSQFNDNGAVKADSILAILLIEAQMVNKQSDGLYDPTVMPLVNAWKKAQKEGRTPSHGYIDSLVKLVGLEKVTIAADSMRASRPGVQLDFSSIAKGLACDEIGRMLDRNGVKNFLVEIGGEVVAQGVNSRGTNWCVSVDMPTDQPDATSHQSALTLTLANEAVATSGNYRKFAIVDGKRVNHIINPKTGFTSQSDLLSVTVVAQHCVTADAWATACMAMGTAATQQLMQSRSDLAVMTISTDSLGHYIIWSNPAFAQKLPQ